MEDPEGGLEGFPAAGEHSVEYWKQLHSQSQTLNQQLVKRLKLLQQERKTLLELKTQQQQQNALLRDKLENQLGSISKQLDAQDAIREKQNEMNLRLQESLREASKREQMLNKKLETKVLETKLAQAKFEQSKELNVQQGKKMELVHEESKLLRKQLELVKATESTTKDQLKQYESKFSEIQQTLSQFQELYSHLKSELDQRNKFCEQLMHQNKELQTRAQESEQLSLALFNRSQNNAQELEIYRKQKQKLEALYSRAMSSPSAAPSSSPAGDFPSSSAELEHCSHEAAPADAQEGIASSGNLPSSGNVDATTDTQQQPTPGLDNISLAREEDSTAKKKKEKKKKKKK